MNKIPVYLETQLVEVKKDEIECKMKDGNTMNIPCDSVISSTGYIPLTIIKNPSKKIYFVGDCDKIGNLRSVI